MEHVAAVTGSATSHRNKNLRNVGPSIQYRLTGADGQSHEFQSYMLPMMLDDMPVFLMGVRNNPAESYRYLRIPADADSSVKGFMQLRAALQNPELRARAAAHFAEKNAVNPGQRPLLEKAADGALQAFARGGFDALVENVPEAERERFLSFTIPTLQLSLAELQAADREQRGLPPLDLSGKNETQHTRWIQQALLTLGSMAQYPAPVFLTLKNFKHVQASVFQIARSPGKNTVYLGCLLLVLGVFSMFYIRDRRIWVWIRPQDAGSQWLAAMTSQRRNLDFNHEFERFKEAFKRLSS
jgi:cytochrome c biogenesis protein